MPRNVDHDQRRRDIVAATNQVISESGLSGLTFRAVGERLGGSTTLVTHYYGSQAELLNGLATSLIETWEHEVAELEANTADAYERLVLFLQWLIPLDDKSRMEERARINLLAEEILGTNTRFMFEAWELRMRQFLRAHLEELVPEPDIETKIDLLRVLTNGLTLSAIEHPDRWPRERLLEVLSEAVAGFGLKPPEPRSTQSARRRPRDAARPMGRGM